jgi:hypothetical protein
MKAGLLFAAILVAINGYAQDTLPKNYLQDTATISERLKLKNNAFCSCLNKVYPGLDDKLNDGSAAAYFETSAYGLEAFERVDSLAASFAAKPVKSKYDRKLGILKCLDFYNSQELEDLVNEIVTDKVSVH